MKIRIEIKSETEKAILCQAVDIKENAVPWEEWLPKSQVTIEKAEGVEVTRRSRRHSPVRLSTQYSAMESHGSPAEGFDVASITPRAEPVRSSTAWEGWTKEGMKEFSEITGLSTEKETITDWVECDDHVGAEGLLLELTKDIPDAEGVARSEAQSHREGVSIQEKGVEADKGDVFIVTDEINRYLVKRDKLPDDWTAFGSDVKRKEWLQRYFDEPTSKIAFIA